MFPHGDVPPGRPSERCPGSPSPMNFRTSPPPHHRSGGDIEIAVEQRDVVVEGELCDETRRLPEVAEENPAWDALAIAAHDASVKHLRPAGTPQIDVEEARAGLEICARFRCQRQRLGDDLEAADFTLVKPPGRRVANDPTTQEQTDPAGKWRNRRRPACRMEEAEIFRIALACSRASKDMPRRAASARA